MSIKKNLLIGFVMFLFPVIIFGANQEFCFVDNFGEQWRFIGGKLGKKAFAAELFHPSCGILVGVSTFPKSEDGTFLMTAVIGRDPTAVCVPIEISASFSGDMLIGSGVFDNFPREFDTDGFLTFTAIDCASIPLSLNKKTGL